MFLPRRKHAFLCINQIVTVIIRLGEGSRGLAGCTLDRKGLVWAYDYKPPPPPSSSCHAYMELVCNFRKDGEGQRGVGTWEKIIIYHHTHPPFLAPPLQAHSGQNRGLLFLDPTKKLASVVLIAYLQLLIFTYIQLLCTI
jgi:hypothetical protein